MIRFVYKVHFDVDFWITRSFHVIILKSFDTGKGTTVYCRCTCHRHTLVFVIRKAWPPPIGACEIDGQPKASMAEQVVTKQNPNSCDRVG